MMGFSTGIDVVSITRMGQAAKRELFLKRVFTPGELGYAVGRRRPDKHLAGRFAAKEAAVKALSLQGDSGMGLKEIEVVNDSEGRPSLRLGPKAQEAARGGKLHLSISYSGDFAFAFVLMGRP